MLFYRDVLHNQLVTKSKLIEDLKKLKVYNPYCKSQDFYQLFLKLIYSLVVEEEIVLLDNDFTPNEIKALLGDDEIDKYTKPVQNGAFDKFDSFEQVVERVVNTGDKWKITLFTSGTTGLPKKITHKYSTLNRFVKTSEKHKEAVWGYAYHPTHIAGLQVFFQAFLNSNPIVRLFQVPPDLIIKEIESCNITHISATPTFYRMLIGQKVSLQTVLRITSGGEKFDDKMLHNLGSIFPNAKITNVYASTEAGTLFASDGNEFMLKTEMMSYVKIEHNELFIHKNILGNSNTLIIKGDWYATGDLVEVIDECPLKFRFLSRKNEMINVGGFKVNPLEVEEEIRKIKGIIDAKVFSKRNSVLGRIVCCDVVREENSSKMVSEKDIRFQLKESLQDFKIPRFIKFVSHLSQTRTGKTKR